MDRQLMLAMGKALMLVASMLQRGGVVEAREFGSVLAVFSVTVGEQEPDQGAILALWAGMIKDMPP